MGLGTRILFPHVAHFVQVLVMANVDSIFTMECASVTLIAKPLRTAVLTMMIFAVSKGMYVYIYILDPMYTKI